MLFCKNLIPGMEVVLIDVDVGGYENSLIICSLVVSYSVIAVC